ncbi:MAG: hypothetical protein GY751_22250, partial [Bacteroidetes bacterium]|nr:hypothetical protein [Bacteroidota bacterium]
RGTVDATTWNQRLGHPGDRKLKQMMKNGSVPEKAAEYGMVDCSTCQLNLRQEASSTEDHKKKRRTNSTIGLYAHGACQKGMER